MTNGGTYEFDEPDTMEDGNETRSNKSSLPSIERTFMMSRRKGKKNNTLEETDDAIYFLTLLSQNWIWR